MADLGGNLWHPRCEHTAAEAIVSTRTYGILAGVIGSALGAWYWTRYRNRTPEAARGTVIYDNTPTASDLSEGII